MSTQDAPSQILQTIHERRREPLGGSVKKALELYLNTLNGYNSGPLYKMVIAEVERPMLETVMKYAKGNQSRAALILGISRSSVRKKLKLYGLD